MSAPSFNEWKKVNIGKGLNEYYQEFPEARLTNSNQPVVINHIQNQYINSSPLPTQNTPIVKNKPNILSIIISVMILVAFFLPWIKVDLFGMFNIVNAGGYELPKIVKTLYGSTDGTMIMLIYLIPIGAFIAAISEAMNLWLKTSAQFATLIGSVYSIFFLKQMIESGGRQFGVYVQAFDFVHVGVWLTYLGCIFFIYEVTLALLKGFSSK